MTPYYADDWLTIYSGDARAVMATMPADSVDCVVTSPPYWGLRDYGNDGQLGLERTPEEYVANMVAVFAEVRRVLKPSGTCWLNLGDSYSGSWSGHSMRPEGGQQRPGKPGFQPLDNRVPKREPNVPGLKPKDLVGIPWRVAFALQADGWYLRSDIIWSKPNPMPESVTDRPTKSHEYLFLLTKSARYYFDADAVREALLPSSVERGKYGWSGKTGEALEMGATPSGGGFNRLKKSGEMMEALYNPAGRNIRSVWSIATRPYSGAHFAVFPPELPERCIKAGSSEKGVCPECGAPWERVVERVGGPPRGDHRKREDFQGQYKQAHATGTVDGASLSSVYAKYGYAENRTTGWAPTCHDHRKAEQGCYAPAVPAVVLDPFGGSGTTGMVAQKLGRRAILIDLNPDYLKQQFARNAQTPLGLTEGDAA